MTIGELIKQHRRSHIPTMTQERLAKEIGIGVNHVNRIEKNKINPRYDLAIKILKHLGVDTKHPLMEG